MVWRTNLCSAIPSWFALSTRCLLEEIIFSLILLFSSCLLLCFNAKYSKIWVSVALSVNLFAFALTSPTHSHFITSVYCVVCTPPYTDSPHTTKITLLQAGVSSLQVYLPAGKSIQRLSSKDCHYCNLTDHYIPIQTLQTAVLTMSTSFHVPL